MTQHITLGAPARLLALALLLSLALVLSACGGDDAENGETSNGESSNGDASSNGDDSTPKTGLAGKWKIVKAEGEGASMNEGTLYTLSADGKIAVGEGLMKTEGSYTRDGATLKYDLGGIELEAEIELKEGDQKLVWKLANSNQVFHMARQ